jgi:protein-S-isoprenylcysteine O-methyltransferase Ste14
LVLWLMKYRKPQDMIASTYYTFAKMIRGSSIQEISGRSEPYMFRGPQKLVRHPLYLGALVELLGWGLLTNSTLNLIAMLVALIWYAAVQIPFEERELRALFVEQYVKYMRETPMLVPFTKQLKH